MKIKAAVLSFLVAIMVLYIGHEVSFAKSKQAKNQPKVGVVSIKKIFQDCIRNAKYRQEAVAVST